MRVDVRRNDDVILVDLEGKLVRGSGDEVLREVVNELLGGNWLKIVFNLSGVTMIDSSGIGELVASQKIARRFGASIKLMRLGERVRTTLIRGQILPLFEIFDDESDAVASFPAAEEAAEGASS